ncbi:hypothetical protein EPUS_07558 [Endocarpon pusillum Z07020]|uniref:Uncharacterized protein n=1 Tax=Endocarpon pusillum (strain Z07020 / HMAS-L-300199) TaxID=1263415 RepID=U1GKI7_ENDPU|nr:uncharacterized protein EPUS_07558 [Endocarpon pusillum Z07020]ERF72396.1 hypothetical protein EPUS_07558 [Endocarpon pusillum Z07020]
MTQKHHQEEISGPIDAIEAAPLAKDCPRPKRARIQSRKARENQTQSQLSQVLSLRPITSTSEQKPISNREDSSSAGNNASQSKQRHQLLRQNSSQRSIINTQHKKEKEEWQIQVESTQNKSEKLKILAEQIGPSRPYPEKLNVPIPSASGQLKLRAHELKPIDLFYRFIPKELFMDIAEHTNEYAFEERSQEFDQIQRVWRDVTAADIGGYIGAILLIGAQPGGRDLAYYWNQKENYPHWPVAEYISLLRFQQISRYLKINRPGPLPDNQWYKKVEPLATHFRKATTPNMYELPQNLSIDEQLVKFKGRSKHTIQMNSKAAGKGYKIYSLCCSNGYMVDFRFSSATEKVAELGGYPEFSQSEAIVLDLAEPFYVLHLDNFFTTRKLYQRLYELGIGANGTAKAGSGIPKELAYLRDAMTKQNDYGEWFNYVVGSVNCIAFCDSASKAMMTTIHDPTMEEYTYFKRIKRPKASLKYAVDAETANAANSANAMKFVCPAPSTNSTPPANSTLSANSAPPTNSTLSAPPALLANSTLPAPPALPANSENKPQYLRKLYALDRYNQEMGGSDNHAKLNSYYSRWDVDEDRILRFAETHWAASRKKLSRRWNRGQIKNAFQTVIALATWDFNDEHECTKLQRPLLSDKHFEVVSQTSAHFDDYISNVHGIEEDDAFAVMAERENLRNDSVLQLKPKRRSDRSIHKSSSRRAIRGGSGRNSSDSEKTEASDDDDNDDKVTISEVELELKPRKMKGRMKSSPAKGKTGHGRVQRQEKTRRKNRSIAEESSGKSDEDWSSH